MRFESLDERTTGRSLYTNKVRLSFIGPLDYELTCVGLCVCATLNLPGSTGFVRLFIGSGALMVPMETAWTAIDGKRIKANLTSLPYYDSYNELFKFEHAT